MGKRGLGQAQGAATRASPRGPFPRAGGSGPCRKWPGLGQAALICFTSRGCLWRPRPPAPATRDWVSSPALAILAVPGESAAPGAWPHFLQPGPCPAPWPQPLGTGQEGPPRPDALTEGPPCSSSVNAEPARPQGKEEGLPGGGSCWEPTPQLFPAAAAPPPGCSVSPPQRCLPDLLPLFPSSTFV